VTHRGVLVEEVSKEKFKEIFLKYGKLSDDYGIDYWKKFYEIAKRKKHEISNKVAVKC